MTGTSGYSSSLRGLPHRVFGPEHPCFSLNFTPSLIDTCGTPGMVPGTSPQHLFYHNNQSVKLWHRNCTEWAGVTATGGVHV